MQQLFSRVLVMAVAIILLFLCNSAWTETTNQPPCPVNEEFSPTGGAMCENCGPSCLALSSEPRCYCKADHSRLNGICIPTELCPKESETPDEHPCPINEEFHPNGGPACEDCGVKCELMLTEVKCYCKTNFSRLYGVCIPNFACPPPETPDEPPCPENEEFRNEGPECENCGVRCETRSPVAKCYCKSGYWRSNGICVPESDCPKEPPVSAISQFLNDKNAIEVPAEHPCPVNEEFRPDGGPACENCGPRCKMWSTEAKCYCKSGHSRMNGICVLDEACEPDLNLNDTNPVEVPDKHPCPANEEFRPDGGPACENCGPQCKMWSTEAKCYCKSGHSRMNGICILDKACPPHPNKHPCPINEVFSPSGGPACENCGMRCFMWSYEAKCYCKSGFSRRNGICIPDSLCPRRPRKVLPEVKEGHKRNRGKSYRKLCPINERFCSKGGPVCENCGRRCLSVNTEPRCYCKEGFSRFNGKCIPNSQCPKTQQSRQCPPGEEFREIGQRYEYCLPYCPGFKRLSKCYCLPGTCRNLFGKCVSPQQCLRYRGSTTDNKKQ